MSEDAATDQEFDPVQWALRSRRKQLGLSAKEVSLRAGLSESSYAKVEGRRVDPSLTTFAKAVHALGLTDLEIAWLVRLVAREAGTS